MSLAGEVLPRGLGGRVALVTGASGFIGTRLCRALREAGAEVHGVSRREREGNGVHWWRADLADVGTAEQVMRHVRPDLVFHLASHVSGTRDLDAVLPTLRDNLLTTVQILTAACPTNPRVVLAGSMEEIEAEDVGAVPSSPYAAAKTSSTMYARMAHALYGLPVLTLRVFMVYGPGQWDRTKLIPYVTRSLLRGESPHLTSGNREIDWVYVDDVVGAFIAAAQADVNGTVVDVGSGEYKTIRSVVEHIVRLTEADVKPLFGALPDRRLERRRCANVARTHELIGWKPSTAFDAGIAKTVQWFRERND